jgi:hypothetical protein
MRFFFPLLCLLCLRPVAAGGAASGRWWCDELQCYHEDYAYVEAIIIVCLVILAVLFDSLHHSLEHFADHSYFYGKLQTATPDAKGSHAMHGPSLRLVKQRTPLFKHWVNRLSQEFMVLGFLAFTVFVFREVGGFEWVVHAFPPEEKPSVHLPQTAEDWLHMVENVHMKLFLGMLIYFLVVLKVVNGCVKHVEFWEEMRILRRNSSSSDDTGEFSSTSAALDHTQLRRYGRWRNYFTQSVVNWRETRPQLYEETLKRLSLWSSDTPSQSRFQRTLDENFPFSAYLAYSVRECCKDTVEVHRITWAAVIVLFSVFAIIHRHTKLILLHFMPVFIVGAFVLLFCVGHLVSTFRERVESAGSHAAHVAAAAEKSERNRTMSFDVESGDSVTLQDVSAGFHERHNTELWVFRTLQICLFVLSYSCARTVGDANDWRYRTTEVLAVGCAFVVLFLVLGGLLPKYVPNFAALMAMPPYCDQKNVDTFFEVLDEYAIQHGIEPAEEKLHIAGSVRPCFLADKPRATPTQENLDAKSAYASFDAAIGTLMQQHHQLAGQVQDLQSSCWKPQTQIMDAAPSQCYSAKPLSCELGMMKVQMARLEALVQAQNCQHPGLNVPSPKDAKSSPSRAVRRWAGSNSTSDLQFFIDPSISHSQMHLERHVQFAGSTRETDEASQDIEAGGVANQN